MQNENFALFSLNAFTRAPLPARLLCPLSMAKFKHNKETYTNIYVYIFNIYTISAVNLQFKCRRGLFSYYLRATYMYHVSFSSVTWGILIISTSGRATVFGGHCFGQQWHFDRLSTHTYTENILILTVELASSIYSILSGLSTGGRYQKLITVTSDVSAGRDRQRAPRKRTPNDH